MEDVIHHTYVCSYCGREFADFKDCIDHEDRVHYSEKFKDKITCEPYFGRYFTYKENGPCDVVVYNPYSFVRYEHTNELNLVCNVYSYTYDMYDDYPTEPHMNVEFGRSIPLTMLSEMREIIFDEFKEFILMALDNNTDCLDYFD
jgi:hypothetical protein